VRGDFWGHIANSRQTDLDGTHADANGAFRQVAIAIAALLVGALIAAAAKKVVNFRFQRVLEHLAGSLAHQPLQHIVRGGHRCGRGQNLDTVWTRRKSPSIGPGDLAGDLSKGGYAASFALAGYPPATNFHKSPQYL